MIHTRTILVVEDSVVTSVAIGRVLEREVPHCRVVRAQSKFEAQVLLKIYQFNLLVLDVQLPDGSGLDLVSVFRSRQPDAPIIVLTGEAEGTHRSRSLALGVHHYFRKPLAPRLLGQAARESLRGVKIAGPTSFTASLRRVSMLDLVQFKCLTGTTTRLEVSALDTGPRRGSIDFQDGEIVHAEVRDRTSAVLAEGENALAEMLTWCGGTVDEVGTPATDRRTINHNWQSVLLRATQDNDEKTAAALTHN